MPRLAGMFWCEMSGREYLHPVAGERVVRSASGSGRSCVLTSAGDLYCWGQPFGWSAGERQHEELQPTIVARGVTDFDMGADSVCTIDAASRVRCWGTVAGSARHPELAHPPGRLFDLDLGSFR